MLHKISINIDPISAKTFFESISVNAISISKLTIGNSIFDIKDRIKTEKRDWFPEDKVIPPYCPYEDVNREEWLCQNYKLINHMRQHSPDDRISGSGGNVFMEMYEDENLLLSITTSNDSKDGFKTLVIGIHNKFNDEEKLNLGIGIFELLKFNEIIKKTHLQ
jgi:hypothetical protein